MKLGIRTSVQRANTIITVLRFLSLIAAIFSFYQAVSFWLGGYDSGVPAIWVLSFALNGLLWKGLTRTN